ncbi:MAG: GNAT family N-acetyltransferase [Candidatus Aminicenantales bacterium]
MVTGYLHPQYAESLSEFGTPRELPRCGGWILERPIPGFPYRDAMGCYPLFACQDWSQLAADLDGLGDDLVSLALVADPFGEYDEACLHRCFDVVISFKEHYVADLHRPINEIVSRHHRYYSRKALEIIRTETCEDPRQHIDEWTALYATLTDRHNVRGLRTFSRAAFLKQLSIPGLVMFRAFHQNTTIGTALCFVQGEVAYGHLMGASEVGHKLGVSYALYWSNLQYFSGKVRWLDWGGTSGVQNDRTDGLSQFKRGWSTGTRTAYLCGRVFDQAKYTALVDAKAIPRTDYFPAYRSGEMG